MAGLGDEETGHTAEVGETEEHDELSLALEAPAKQYVTKKPLELAERFFPTPTKWLKLAGYEDALVIKDKTHICLYCSTTVSILCVLLWFSDVFQMTCMWPRPWIEGGIPPVARCGYEVAGIIIFIGSLMDCIVMIGHYDNEHQVLLQKKNKLMSDLNSDVKEATAKAKKNAEELTKLLVKGLEDKVVDFEKAYYSNIIPWLLEDLRIRVQNQSKCLVCLETNFKDTTDVSLRCAECKKPACVTCEKSECNHSLCELHFQDAKEAVWQMLKTFNDLVDDILGEPARLAAAMCKKLAKASNRAMGRTTEFQEKRVQEEVEKLWTNRFEDLKTRYKRDGSRGLAEIAKALQHSGKASIKNKIFDPLDTVGDFLEEWQKSNGGNQIEREEGTDTRIFGCGKPPWRSPQGSEVGCVCCMPRLLSHFLKLAQLLIACVGKCICRAQCAAVKSNCGAFKYPKGIQFGGIWFQVMSKLHERMIGGLVLSILFLMLYVYNGAIDVTASAGCAKVLVENAQFYPVCVIETARRALLLAALCLHIPCAWLCLLRVKELDAVMDIMEDIRKIQEIRGAVSEMQSFVSAGEQSQGMLEAIQKRCVDRIEMISEFRQHVGTLRREVTEHKKDKWDMRRELEQKLRCLMGGLELAKFEFKDVEAWMEEDRFKQKESAVATIRRAKKIAAGLRPIPDRDALNSAAHRRPEFTRQLTPPLLPTPKNRDPERGIPLLDMQGRQIR